MELTKYMEKETKEYQTNFCPLCEKNAREREKIYTDLMKIADDGEFEDMRREIIRYFNK